MDIALCISFAPKLPFKIVNRGMDTGARNLERPFNDRL